MAPKRTYLDITIGDSAPQRVILELDADRVPKTVENFRALCTGERGYSRLSQQPLHYKGTKFHRVIDGFMVQSGDFTKHNGTGGESIYGGQFADEDLKGPELDRAGLLAMANKGPDTNSSQWFITLDECPHLNGKHVIFGKVVKGLEVIESIAKVETNSKDVPVHDVVIVNCGELVKKAAAPAPIPTTTTTSAQEQEQDPSPSRRRSRAGSDTDGDESGSSTDSEKLRKREKKARKEERRRRKEGGKKDKSRLRGMVEDYGKGGVGGGREETEDELDARLEREENERLEAERKERLVAMKKQLEEEQKRAGAGGIVYKGRGAMRYLDPERQNSHANNSSYYGRIASDRMSHDRPYNNNNNNNNRNPARDREEYSSHRRQHQRDEGRRRSRSPPGVGKERWGGVDGDWRVGRQAKAEGRKSSRSRSRSPGPRFEKERGPGGRGDDSWAGRARNIGFEKEKSRSRSRSRSRSPARDKSDRSMSPEATRAPRARGERADSEESMEMDMDDD